MLEHCSLGNTKIGEVVSTFEVPEGARNLILGVSATPKAGNRESGVLLQIIFKDRLGNFCEPNRKLNRSPSLGNFFYLKAAEGDSPEALLTTLATDIPSETVLVELQGRQWAKDNDAEVSDIWAYFISDDGLDEHVESLPTEMRNSIPDWAARPRQQRSGNRTPPEKPNSVAQRNWAIQKEILPTPRGNERVANSFRKPLRKSAQDFRVAMITDEFTFNSFSPEFDAFAVDPESWKVQFEALAPDILFCESAWAAVSPSSNSWKGKIYGSVKFNFENRTTLFEILKYCKSKGIPTVFWNKEDPTHHHDRVNDFVSTASRFDYIFTTAEECVDSYRKFKERDAVGVLPFAAQPRIFNPIEIGERKREAVFAGAWYQIHEERSQKMRDGFGFVLDAGTPLTIYDRDFGTDNPSRQYPKEYKKYLRRSVPHERTAEIYRQAQIGLNFNTVNGSNTMFARRVFELAASGTQIVSDYSPGVEKFYGDDVIFFNRGDDKTLDEYSDTDLRANSQSAFKKTMLSHTYRQRFETILNLLGLAYTSARPAPTMISVVASKEDAEKAVDKFKAHRRQFSRLLIAVSEDVPTHEASAFLTDYSNDFVDVVIVSLIRKEAVPTSNYLFTPEAILVDPDSPLDGKTLEALKIHGEYSDEPILVVSKGDSLQAPRWGAGVAQHGLRVTAQDVLDVLLDPKSVRQLLEVSL